MITLADPEQIPLTHKAFRNWMHGASFKAEELDQRENDIQTNYWRNSTSDTACRERDSQLLNLKWDLCGLKWSMEATFAIWRQLKDEMNLC
jgi:hypothetical protein